MTGRVQQILDAALAGAGPGVTIPDVLCSACAAELEVSGAGMALMTSQGHDGPIAATNGPAQAMEDLQFSLGEGPCLDASRLRRPVLQPNLRHTAFARWPGFGPPALEAGIEAIFAFPLQVGGIRLGVLDLYRDRAGELSPDELAEAFAFADAGTRILLHLQDQMPLDGRLHPHLARGSHNRREVHQATGMIAAQAAVGLTDALLLLRARAYSGERSLLEVARDVLSHSLRFSSENRNHD